MQWIIVSRVICTQFLLKDQALLFAGAPDFFADSAF
jgi:hypothetical protein